MNMVFLLLVQTVNEVRVKIPVVNHVAENVSDTTHVTIETVNVKVHFAYLTKLDVNSIGNSLCYVKGSR